MDSISIFDVFAICEVGEVGPTSGGSQVQLERLGDWEDYAFLV